MFNSIKNLFTRRNLGIAGLTILGFLIFLVAVNFGLEKYNQNKQWREMKKSADAFQKAEQELYQKMMGDAYGGKTPQETLDMYIVALEKGDYELASRYMVSEKQEEEAKGLLNIKDSQEFMKNYLTDLKKVEADGALAETEDTFRMKTKTELGPYYFIRFIKYSNGIWKIIEI